MAARSIHSSFYAKASSLLTIDNSKTQYDDTTSLETLAFFLTQALRSTITWLRHVSPTLRTSRRNAGFP